MTIAVVVPSRGRPEAARLTIEAIRDTQARADTYTVLVVDADDPTLPDYRAMLASLPGPRLGSERRPSLVVLDPDETGNLVRATNTVSMRIAGEDPDTVIGNLGDDHHFVSESDIGDSQFYYAPPKRFTAELSFSF